MQQHGFNVLANPMGTLYNPLSIANCLERAVKQQYYTSKELYLHEGTYHCLDYQAADRGTDPREVLHNVNSRFKTLIDFLATKPTLIITLGTARVYNLNNHGPVGNCHKLPGNLFTVEMMDVDTIVALWSRYLKEFRLIFTVSPIRYVADGLHANQLSKSRLLLATEKLCDMGAEYFPAYEIMLDDLRDYRFYAADMKHPSDVAVDYIFEKFGDTYFDDETKRQAALNLKEWKRSQHRSMH